MEHAGSPLPPSSNMAIIGLIDNYPSHRLLRAHGRWCHFWYFHPRKLDSLGHSQTLACSRWYRSPRFRSVRTINKTRSNTNTKNVIESVSMNLNLDCGAAGVAWVAVSCRHVTLHRLGCFIIQFFYQNQFAAAGVYCHVIFPVIWTPTANTNQR